MTIAKLEKSFCKRIEAIIDLMAESGYCKKLGQEMDALTTNLTKIIKALDGGGSSEKSSDRGRGRGKNKEKKGFKNNDIGHVSFAENGDVILTHADGTEENTGQPYLFHHQQEVVDCEERNQFWLKARQLGFTKVAIAWKIIKRAVIKGNGAALISSTKLQAAEARDALVELAARYLHVKLTGTDKILLTKNGKPFGCKFVFRGARAASAQSFDADVYFDEVFWMPSGEYTRLEMAASAMGTLTNYIRVKFSAPSSVSHPAWAEWEGDDLQEGDTPRPDNKLKRDDGVFRRTWTMDDAVKHGYDKPGVIPGYEKVGLVDLKQLKKENPKWKYDQLYGCKPYNDGDSAFPWEVVQHMLSENADTWEEVANQLLWGGFDGSESGLRDAGALVLTQPPGATAGKYRVRLAKSWKGINFSAQANEAIKIMEPLNIGQLSVDTTNAVGRGCFQILTAKIAATRELFSTNQKKVDVVMNGKDIIDNKRVHVDADDPEAKELVMGLMRIKTATTARRGMPTYSTERTKGENSNHADLSWAFLYSLDGHEIGTRRKSTIAFMD